MTPHSKPRERHVLARTHTQFPAAIAPADPVEAAGAARACA
ncbi:MAG TPA: hypothetical protein VFC97_05800 [Verrucomicrobiae bacterium]|nr:hypothetical protein [Verrucomicrobiae bacterium]